MRTRKWSEISARVRADPVRAAQIEEIKHAMRDALALAELRANRGLTQRDLADALAISQARVSKIEHQEDVYLSTLRQYVAALGGRLEITAVFPDEAVALVRDHE